MHLGRINNVRKTFILKIDAWINTVLPLFFILLTIFYFERYDLWFFIFSFFCGSYLLLKAFLFKSDSSLYLGSLLLFIGLFGFFVNLFSLKYEVVFMLGAVAFASLGVFVFFKQFLHLILAFMFMYEAFLNYLFLSNSINLTIFLTLNLILLFIFLFICAIIFVKLNKRS